MLNRSRHGNSKARWDAALARVHAIGFPLAGLTVIVCCLAITAIAESSSDPVLDLLLQKGIVTEAEVQKARADAERIRTNEFNTLMPPMESKWKISKAIKNLEI